MPAGGTSTRAGRRDSTTHGRGHYSQPYLRAPHSSQRTAQLTTQTPPSVPSVSTATSLLKSGRWVSDLSLEEFVTVIRDMVRSERQSDTGQPTPVTSAACDVPASDGDADSSDGDAVHY